MGQLLFGFSGRLARVRYFVLSLVAGIIFVGAAFVLAVRIYATGARINGPILIACALLLVLVGIVILSLTVRRLHDLDLSGWWVLPIWIVPSAIESGMALLADNPQLGSLLSGALGLVISLFLWLAPGTRGSNRFGSDPRGKG
jgi:uncharacterized membrane protein YhaH (DUF805 family)